MGEITDLDVDRVDGVDRPATKRKFLITKVEGDESTDEVTKSVIGAAKRAVGALKGTQLPASAAGAIRALAAALGEEAKSEDYPEIAAPVETAKAEPLTADGIAEAVVKALKAAAGESDRLDVERTAPASSQPIGQEAVTKAVGRKLGDGLFTDIVFDRPGRA